MSTNAAVELLGRQRLVPIRRDQRAHARLELERAAGQLAEVRRDLAEVGIDERRPMLDRGLCIFVTWPHAPAARPALRSSR